MTLLDLAARCEAAAGPDLELDRAIALATDPHYLDHFTASLDAAMTLVECRVDQIGEWDAPSLRHNGPWFALVARRGDDAANGRCDHAATPALALCAAALRARASQETPA